MKVQGRFSKGSECEHSPAAHARIKQNMSGKSSSNGVMEEGSGKVQKAKTHKASVIVVDVAILQSHVAAIDAQPPALPNKEGNGHGKVIQRGDGRRFREGSEARIYAMNRVGVDLTSCHGDCATSD